MHNVNVMIPRAILGQECSAAFLQWILAFEIINTMIDSYDWGLFNEQKTPDLSQIHNAPEELTPGMLEDYQLAHTNLINMFFEKTGIEICMSEETSLIDKDYNDIDNGSPFWITAIELSATLNTYEGVLVGSRY